MAYVHHYPGEAMAPGCTVEKQDDGHVTVWSMHCWETVFFFFIYVEGTLQYSTYLSIIKTKHIPSW